MNGNNNDELPEYEFDDEPALQTTNDEKKTIYTGVLAAGFKDFLLKGELNRAITDCGFEHPSEVQQECIPHAITNKDILCQAQSGMGKTAVFILSILQQLDDEPKANSCLVLCNTRELAYQIKNEFLRFTKHLPKVKTEVIYGGASRQDQVKMLKGENPPHIIVGTPGRILSLVKTKDLVLDNLQTFVLDECDKMLEETDMRRDVQSIFMSTPPQKQVMMFSATMSQNMKNIGRKFMKNPFELFIDQEGKLTLHGLKQYYVKLDENQKIARLMELLDSLMFNQVIIFVKKLQSAIKLDDLLRSQMFPSVCIYGSLPQEERIKRYNEFKAFKYRIMVSTDIFGRGIDIEKINIVFNFDMPDKADTYLHKVGRAGRFGTKGLAITFTNGQEEEEVKLLEEIQKKFEVKIEELPTTIDVSSYMNN